MTKYQYLIYEDIARIAKSYLNSDKNEGKSLVILSTAEGAHVKPGDDADNPCLLIDPESAGNIKILIADKKGNITQYKD